MKPEEETLEQEKEEIEEGNTEENVYSEAGREVLIEEDDEINDVDEGFMKGYEEGEQAAKCPICKGVIEDDFVEKEIDGEMYRFCCEAHLEKFERQQQHTEGIVAGDSEEESKED